jgi:hypothetical protein
MYSTIVGSEPDRPAGCRSHALIGCPSNPEKVTSDAWIVSRRDSTSAATAGDRFARLSASVDDQNVSKSAGSSSGGR